MNEPTNDNNIDHEMNNNIVLSDSAIAKYQLAKQEYVKLLLKQRMAMFTKAKALGKAASVAEEPALELWEEMPRAAKEFETFDSDEDSAV